MKFLSGRQSLKRCGLSPNLRVADSATDSSMDGFSGRYSFTDSSSVVNNPTDNYRVVDSSSAADSFSGGRLE